MSSTAGMWEDLGTALLVLSSRGLIKVHVLCLFFFTGKLPLDEEERRHLWYMWTLHGTRDLLQSFSVYSYLSVVSFWTWPWIRMGHVLQQNEDTVLAPKNLQSDTGQDIRKTLICSIKQCVIRICVVSLVSFLNATFQPLSNVHC